jgi:hypothetical protein
MVEKAIAEGVLDKTVHARLIQNIDQVAKDANVPVPVICKSVKPMCSPEELAYIVHMHSNVNEGMYGMVFTGPPTNPMNTKMMGIAGACLRNYIRARVMTVQTVLDDLKANKMEQPTVLLIPNFYVGKKQGGHIPDWQVSQLLGMLYSRQSAGLQTFLYVADIEGLHQEYGELFKSHLTENFLIVQA